ncbi:hypothetical protein ACLB2K_070168 [Fragaria x ananassa]
MFNGYQFYEFVPVTVPVEQLFHHDHDNGLFTSDDFRMYSYKIKRCPRMRSHDWTDCPYAHRGEKAQRRDPRRYPYSAIVCPAFRNGICYKGDACQYAHGVFEYWLHPARYRTRVCNAGLLCTRKVCFFAHSPDQLRTPPPESTKSFKCRQHHHNHVYRPVGDHLLMNGANGATSVRSPERLATNNNVNVAGRFSKILSSLRALRLSDQDGNGGSGEMDVRVDEYGMPETLDVGEVDWVSELLHLELKSGARIMAGYEERAMRRGLAKI